MDSQKPRRNTRQRQVVLEELRKVTSHPTAAQLYELARQRLPRISLGTVYRNLDLLVELGLARKIEAGGSEARFDADLSQHLHVRCVRCGCVDDVPGPVLDPAPARDEVARRSGYRIHGHRLEFVGLCPRCLVDDRAGCG